MDQVRQPAVAGSFYPANATILSGEVSRLLDAARSRAEIVTDSPKVLIVPHAGYIYSGSTAALAYAQLSAVRDSVRRVVLLGPVHRVPVRGLALAGATAFATPLGEIELDADATRLLADLPQVVVSAAAHAREHSMEVQLPFLQTVLGKFKLVPLAVGDATPAEVAEVLETLWGGPETLIVISSDLSHFLPYRDAQAIDQETARRIISLSGPITHDQACGGTPINGLLLAAKKRHLRPHLLGLCNSGDTAGDRGRVVGYAAFAFTQAPMPSTNAGQTLLPIARASIARALGQPYASDESAPWLMEPGACFITLTQKGQLRGCIGSLEARRSLIADVKGNAVAAAFHDPRFSPLERHELDHTRIEISLLSPMLPMTFSSEADALSQLKPGVDGVVFEYGSRRSTFLPQVWEQLPDAAEFIAHLKHKAGVPPAFWAEEIRLLRYSVSKWREASPTPRSEATPSSQGA